MGVPISQSTNRNPRILFLLARAGRAPVVNGSTDGGVARPLGAVLSCLARLFVFFDRRECYPDGHTITSSELVIRYLERAASPADSQPLFPLPTPPENWSQRTGQDAR
jgi:hypothetical protein